MDEGGSSLWVPVPGTERILHVPQGAELPRRTDSRIRPSGEVEILDAVELEEIEEWATKNVRGGDQPCPRKSGFRSQAACSYGGTCRQWRARPRN